MRHHLVGWVLALAGCGSSGGNYQPPHDLAMQQQGGDAAMQQMDAAMQQMDGTGFVFPPSCTVTVTPKNGTLNDNYTATLTSTDANGCSYQLDNTQPVIVACNGMIMGNAQQFGGAGDHVALVTVNGPGGSNTCMATWTIAAQVKAPTCMLGVMPMKGTLADTYAFTLASTDTTSCTFQIDQGPPQPLNPCMGMQMLPGNIFGAGNHSVNIAVMGPGGMGGCGTTLSIN